MTLQEKIEHFYSLSPEKRDRESVLAALGELKTALNSGAVRTAEKKEGTWKVNSWVKKGILLAFSAGLLTEYGSGPLFRFFDKDTMDVKKFSLESGVRIVPGGSIVRDGAYVAPGVVMMPPSYVNIGAYVGEHTMIDSHALVGSCAQVGKRVHLSAAAQIGGVLEPIGSMPVIIEDDVFIGGNCGIYEGTIVEHHAVIGSGVILTGSTPVYDIERKKIYRKTAAGPLVIPARGVVIPGSRAISDPFAVDHKIAVYTPVIIKYRDEKTDASVVLEENLR